MLEHTVPNYQDSWHDPYMSTLFGAKETLRIFQAKREYQANWEYQHSFNLEYTMG